MTKLLIRFIAAAAILYGLGAHASMPGVRRRAEQPLREVQKLVNPKTGKEVVLVGMYHLGTEEGYAEIRRYLDTLKAQGYVTFLEGCVLSPFHIDTINDLTSKQLREIYAHKLSTVDSMRLDTLMRKYRRMLGFMLRQEGYADSDNASLRGDPEKRKQYVSQDNTRLGVMTEKDLWVDYSLADRVEICEKRYGKINLTDYDFQTGLFEKYTPEKQENQRARSYFTLFSRNDYVVRRIAESKHSKIAVVYGAAHSYGIVYFLKKSHGFKRDKRYKAQ